MNKSIYVIIQYDDAWETNLFAVSDEETAKAEVTRLEENHKRLSEVYTAVNTVMTSSSCSVDKIKLPPKPRGPAVSSKESMATYQEQVAEWKKICKPIQEENDRTDREWVLGMHMKVQDKLNEFDLSKEDYKTLGFNSENKTRWYVYYNTDKYFTYQEIVLR